MNNTLLLTGLALSVGALVMQGRRRRLAAGHSALTGSDNPEPQPEVVYAVDDLDEAISWYNTFLGVKEPGSVGSDGPVRYATYDVGTIQLTLQTGTGILRPDCTLFYWMLPAPADVEAKYQQLKKLKKTHFERPLDPVHRVARRKQPAPPLVEEPVEEVLQFTVIDPSGNRIGVINNPIYTPKMADA